MLLKPTLEVLLLSLALICTLLQNSHQELIQGKKFSVGTFALQNICESYKSKDSLRVSLKSVEIS